MQLKTYCQNLSIDYLNHKINVFLPIPPSLILTSFLSKKQNMNKFYTKMRILLINVPWPESDLLSSVSVDLRE